ncbi:NDT80 domain-containing protein [Balamuthia mandrillaris]
MLAHQSYPLHPSGPGGLGTATSSSAATNNSSFLLEAASGMWDNFLTVPGNHSTGGMPSVSDPQGAVGASSSAGSATLQQVLESVGLLDQQDKFNSLTSSAFLASYLSSEYPPSSSAAAPTFLQQQFLDPPAVVASSNGYSHHNHGGHPHHHQDPHPSSSQADEHDYSEQAGHVDYHHTSSPSSSGGSSSVPTSIPSSPISAPASPHSSFSTGVSAPKQWRLCVKAPPCGAFTGGCFYLFADPAGRVAELIPNIEMKIWELYHTFVQVDKVQTTDGVDLPPSFIVESVLKNHSFCSVQYSFSPEVVRAQQLLMNSQMMPVVPAPTPALDYFGMAAPPMHHSHHHHQQYAHHQSDSPSPAYPHKQQQHHVEVEAEENICFRESPPSKVIQNKEFSFSVSLRRRGQRWASHSKGGGSGGNRPAKKRRRAGSSTGGSSPKVHPNGAASVHPNDNVWGAPVAVPDERGTPYSDDEVPEVPVEVVIEEEAGDILEAKDYSIRSSVLDKLGGVYVFFVKIKKNSHYGRTRFIIKVREWTGSSVHNYSPFSPHHHSHSPEHTTQDPSYDSSGGPPSSPPSFGSGGSSSSPSCSSSPGPSSPSSPGSVVAAHNKVPGSAPSPWTRRETDVNFLCSSPIVVVSKERKGKRRRIKNDDGA